MDLKVRKIVDETEPIISSDREEEQKIVVDVSEVVLNDKRISPPALPGPSQQKKTFQIPQPPSYRYPYPLPPVLIPYSSRHVVLATSPDRDLDYFCKRCIKVCYRGALSSRFITEKILCGRVCGCYEWCWWMNEIFGNLFHCH